MSETLTASTMRPFITNGGREIQFTSLGFGAAALGNYRKTLSENDCKRTLETAWDCGLRYYDTSPLYGFGLSEQRVGRVLKSKPRNEYVLSTKVGRLLVPCPPEEADGIFFENIPPFKFIYDYSYDGIMKSYGDSQKRIGVDRFDILFVHDIDSYNHGGRDGAEARTRELIDLGGWKALSELRASGDVAAIGIGVNEWEPCARMLELADPDLFLLAGRYTLLEHQPLTTLFPECARHNVGVIIGGPYNSGVLAGGDTYNYAFDFPENVRSRISELAKVCRRFDVAMPAAALQFVLAHPVVMSVIPGSQTVIEVQNNAALIAEQIPADFWAALKDSSLLPESAPTPESVKACVRPTF